MKLISISQEEQAPQIVRTNQFFADKHYIRLDTYTDDSIRYNLYWFNGVNFIFQKGGVTYGLDMNDILNLQANQLGVKIGYTKVGFINPKTILKSENLVMDELYRKVIGMMARAEEGVYNEINDVFYKGDTYRGVHTIEDGTTSTNVDYRIKTVITNSLLSYYVGYYRHCMPKIELEILKLIEL